MADHDRCPTCRQPIGSVDENGKPIPRRVCYDCGRPIAHHHKWTMKHLEGGVTAMAHRHCCQPESYCRAAEGRRQGVVGYKNLTDEQVIEITANEDELERRFAEWRQSVGR